MAVIAGRHYLSTKVVAQGAIAQLGERFVRNEEVGGSIPPGSTTLRPSGFARRSHVMGRSAKRARRSPKGEGGLAASAPAIIPRLATSSKPACALASHR